MTGARRRPSRFGILLGVLVLALPITEGLAQAFDGAHALDQLRAGPGTLPVPGWRVEVGARSWEHLAETLETTGRLTLRRTGWGTEIGWTRLGTPSGDWNALRMGLILGTNRARIHCGAVWERFRDEEAVPVWGRLVLVPLSALALDVSLEHDPAGPTESTRMAAGAYVGMGDWAGGILIGPGDRIEFSVALRATPALTWSARFDNNGVGAGIEFRFGSVKLGGDSLSHAVLGRVAAVRLRMGTPG